MRSNPKNSLFIWYHLQRIFHPSKTKFYYVLNDKYFFFFILDSSNILKKKKKKNGNSLLLLSYLQNFSRVKFLDCSNMLPLLSSVWQIYVTGSTFIVNLLIKDYLQLQWVKNSITEKSLVQIS